MSLAPIVIIIIITIAILWLRRFNYDPHTIRGIRENYMHYNKGTMSPTYWIEPFLELSKKLFAMKQEYWIDDSPVESDIRILEKYAESESAIDKANFREDMLNKWKSGEVSLKVRELPGRTRFLFLGTEEQWSQIPWDFWVRIFQAAEHPIGHFVLYADPRPRVDPKEESEIESKHINGGFSYLCQQNVIVVYRFEEATRVLLHELLHTMCFDAEKGVEELEAITEAWTEVFLCAILSRGSRVQFNKLWSEQIGWMTEQSQSLSATRNVKGPADYAWRYINGKRDVLEKLGFLRGFNSYKHNQTTSLRFTTPLWDAEMLR